MDVAKARNVMWERAATTRESTQQILNGCTNSLSDVAASQLPSQAAMKKSIRRARVKAGNAPPNPMRLQDLQLPEDFRQTLQGEEFLLYDSGEADGEEHFLIFSSKAARTNWNCRITGSPMELF